MSIASPRPIGFEPLARKQPSLVDQVAEELGRRIRSGTFRPGEMLPSAQTLCEAWGISRTVMREALSRLSADGLIHSRQGLGVFVAETLPPVRLDFLPGSDTGDLARILELRMGLETEAAALAALRREKQDLRRMRDALQAMGRHLNGGETEKGIDADLDFHRAICQATGNEYFERFFTFLSQFLYRNISVSRRNSATLRGRGMQAQSEHEAILDAISRQDGSRARSAMRKHIVNTGRRLGLDEPARMKK